MSGIMSSSACSPIEFYEGLRLRIDHTIESLAISKSYAVLQSRLAKGLLGPLALGNVVPDTEKTVPTT